MPNYRQRIANAMLAMGAGESTAAEAEWLGALEAARAVDAGGAREAEVLSYLAEFYQREGRVPEADAARRQAALIYARFNQEGQP